MKRIGRYKIKNLDCHIREWFDKHAGNSYFSGRIVVNFSEKSEKTLFLPFQYGYGSAWEAAAQEALGWKEPLFWTTCSQHGIVLRVNREYTTKKLAKDFGNDPRK